MIDLGLKRIAQLVTPSSLPWKAIHVAGTNGKGSVCAYLSSALHAAGIRVGRFTSPHLIDRWDCISIHNTPVSRAHFLEAEKAVLALNSAHNIGASEFELLTATAFEIFIRSQVEIAVVEVGMGGAEDATNVLTPENVLVSVVTKIGLDHQGFLGNTLEEIAGVKAGIAKEGRPVVVDASNPVEVVEVISRVAHAAGAGQLLLAQPENLREGCTEITTPSFGTLKFSKHLPGGYQPANLSCAINALSAIAPQFPALKGEGIVEAVAKTRWPGRLEHLDVSPIVPGAEVLVDGAHNPQAQLELRKYVDQHIRPNAKDGKVWWVLAATKGKDVGAMIEELVGEGDAVVATHFGAVDGMPWIQAVQTGEIAGSVRNGKVEEVEDCADAVKKAVTKAQQEGAAVVVAGSL
ncbi:Mur ligase [Sphaerosporella brunnea]|uniref:Mur ligase n=1 Tax=Sphaerosporella brunnea TaxID=1250544 RepID=A0A5J5F6A6_9PEZI|nr:Mur ligase [Sphaerosporella brunnea]